MNSKAEYNRSWVPRLRVDMEGWKLSKEKDKEEEPADLMEGAHEEEYEILISERVQKRKGDSGDTEAKQRKAKLR